MRNILFFVRNEIKSIVLRIWERKKNRASHSNSLNFHSKHYVVFFSEHSILLILLNFNKIPTNNLLSNRDWSHGNTRSIVYRRSISFLWLFQAQLDFYMLFVMKILLLHFFKAENRMCNKFITILYQIENKNPCNHISCVYSLSSYKKYDRHLNIVLIISNLANLILIQRILQWSNCLMFLSYICS